MRATEPITAKRMETTAEELVIVLQDRSVRIPWQQCSPALAAATQRQRRQAERSPRGYGVRWPLIDEDLSISGLLRKV